MKKPERYSSILSEPGKAEKRFGEVEVNDNTRNDLVKIIVDQAVNAGIFSDERYARTGLEALGLLHIEDDFAHTVYYAGRNTFLTSKIARNFFNLMEQVGDQVITP